MVFAGGIFSSPGGIGASGLPGVDGADGLLSEPVDAREASGSIIPNTSGLYDLGSNSKRWREVIAASGIFGSNSVNINDTISIINPGTDVSLQINQTADNKVVWITQNANDEAVRITQAGSNIGLFIDKTEATFGNALQVNNAGFRDGLEINQAGNGIGIEVNQAGDVVAVSINKTSVGIGVGLRVINAGIDEGITVKMSNPSFASDAHTITTTRAANSGFNFGEYFSDDGSDSKFRFRGDGALFSDIASATPADYAEYFECVDLSGIAAGYAVQYAVDGLIEPASSGTTPLGIVSARPAIVADAAWNHWHNKYLLDDFGAPILDGSGYQTLNPAWSSGLEYTSREDRPEWVTVGLLGKIWARTHDETILAGDYVYVGTSGIMTKATDQEPRWLVIASGLAYDPAKGYGTARILYK